MGLIKAALGAAGGTLADSWKEFFTCDALPKDTLVVRGQKQTSHRSSNTKGSDNVITDGSGVIVSAGQCILITEQGKIVEVCSEPGEYTYNNSVAPTIFCGNLGEGIKKTFSEIGKRFVYGGEAPKDQRVYYVNIKEIMGNMFGTATPIPFRVVDRNLGLDIDVAVRCNGVYSYRITDPLIFFTNVCGNIVEDFTRSEIDSQLKPEFIHALQPSFAEISQMEVRPNQLPSYVDQLADIMNKNLMEKWQQLRGLSVVTIALNSVTLPEEDAELIKTAQKNAILRDPTMAAATIAGAQADAMKAAAANEGGAMNGFIGMGMAMNAGGANTANLFAMGQQNQAAQQSAPQPAAPAAGGWTCECGATNTGKFCTECGKPKPEETGWTCACGAKNTGKFCTECGKPKPASGKWFCPNCGAENEGKFCTECGKSRE